MSIEILLIENKTTVHWSNNIITVLDFQLFVHYFAGSWRLRNTHHYTDLRQALSVRGKFYCYCYNIYHTLTVT